MWLAAAMKAAWWVKEREVGVTVNMARPGRPWEGQVGC
jgi:hypothetical protein